MSQRKLKRKAEEGGRPNLRLVAPPKRRRRALKLPRALRRSLRPKYDHNHTLHLYEEGLVLKALRERGGYGSVESLMREQPDRWRPTYLGKVFKRLHKHRLVERLGHRHHRGARYDLPKGGAHERV